MTTFFTRITLLLLIVTAVFGTAVAQNFPGAGGGRGGAQMNIGRFYGKIVDEKGKGVGYAAVQLYGMRFDSTTRKPKETLIGGQISEENGDFSLENLPIMGDFTLKVSFLGYTDVEQKVSFGIPMPGRGQQGGGMPPSQSNSGDRMASLAGKVDKDLGNIVLALESQSLQEVTVRATGGSGVLALDKKVFKVDKNAMAVGGTAEDALRNVPSVSVDLDGNVTLRNAAPQLFIDGRPTTLSLDQIPAESIESIEVITNPSSRYDASGGQAGIVNVVLKKDRRVGYNGSVRGGIDSRARVNMGGDINARDGKINLFAGGNFNQRRNLSMGETERQNLFGTPLTNVLQTSDNENNGFFASGRGGLDWFMDNRNTLTINGNIHGGSFEPEDLLNIKTDSLLTTGIASSESIRESLSKRKFRNLGAALLYKHIFPKDGKEWTADLNYNSSKNNGEGNFTTTFPSSSYESRERQASEGENQFITIQTDYVNPINDKMKIELGARAALRDYTSNNNNFVYDPTDDTWIYVPNFGDQYKFNDKVFAAYGTFSHQFPKWGYMVGLRAESSQYTGTLVVEESSFKNDYPLSLFPSVFVTRKLNEEDNIQMSYTRRINRPNFFQLIPFTDFSDSLNLQRGNPDLVPEFTNSLEMSYQNIFAKGHNLLVSVYYKEATDLITRYQFTEINQVLGREVVVSSYTNSNRSQAYGVEFTLRNTFWEILELTSNVNLYNSIVDATNIESGLRNEQFTYFIKENLSIRLPKSFTLQINGEYQSRTAFSSGGGGGGRHGGGGGGGGWWGGPTNTAQGYTIPVWFVDVALRKDIFKRKGTITLNVQDIFRTRKTGSHSESEFFIQDTWRLRDPQLVRLNFSYRFGKMDASLFKRKNNKVSTEGMDMMQ